MAASSSTPVHLEAVPRNGRNGRNGVLDNELGRLIERTDSSASSSSSSWDLLPQEPVTVVDLGSNEQLYEHDTPVDSDNGKSTSENDFVANMREKMMEELGGRVWDASKQSARRFYDLYANIDFLRPFFDVEPKDVIKRLIHSMMPKRPGKPQTVPGELYGPIMVVFTLIAVLLFSMKSSGHKVQEGTLMGTALSVCFGYWIGASSFYYFIAYLCNTHITMLQVLTLTGYGLFGHCITIFMTTVSHHNSHLLFYSLLVIFGGLSSLKMIGVFVSRTWRKKNGLVVGVIIAVIHLLFLIYLHFAYHIVYEDVASILSRTKRESSQLISKNVIDQLVLEPTKVLYNTVENRITAGATIQHVTFGTDDGNLLNF